MASNLSPQRSHGGVHLQIPHQTALTSGAAGGANHFVPTFGTFSIHFRASAARAGSKDFPSGLRQQLPDAPDPVIMFWLHQHGPQAGQSIAVAFHWAEIML